MHSGIPNTMKAVVIEGDHAALRDDVPLPFIEDGFMLIKPVAVASNPTEWKHIDYKLGSEGAVLGCDVVGQILKLGSGIIGTPDEFRVGDYVASFVHGGSKIRPYNGAFAEYVAVDSATTYRLPDGLARADKDFLPEGPVTTYEGAASLPITLTTAGAILVHDFGVNLEWKPTEPQINSPLLIWGGATGVGQYLIQLAKDLHAFTKIIVVASREHEKVLREYGADDFYDYHDAGVVDQIKAKYKNIQYLVDAVSSEETIKQVYRCASDTLSATVMQLVFLNIDHIDPEDRKENVKMIGTLVYLATGLEVPIGKLNFPANPQYRKDVIKFVKFISPRIMDGNIHHMPIKIYRDGLAGIPKLTDIIRKGKTSGEKLVTVL